MEIRWPRNKHMLNWPSVESSIAGLVRQYNFGIKYKQSGWSFCPKNSKTRIAALHYPKDHTKAYHFLETLWRNKQMEELQQRQTMRGRKREREREREREQTR